MVVYRNNLIFGSIKRFFVGILKAIYKFLSFLHLQVSLLIFLIGIVLYITGVFDSSGAFFSIYLVVFICSVAFALIRTILKWISGDKLLKKRGKVEVNQQVSTQLQPTNSSDINGLEKGQIFAQNSVNGQLINQSVAQDSVYPKYYTVRQNSNYLMAEFSDRYELYLKTSNGLKKIRVDYKK